MAKAVKPCWRIFLGVSVLAVAGLYTQATACSCKQIAPQEAFEKADAVFSGTVERFEPDDTTYEEATAYPGQRKYVIKENQLTAWITVTKKWKGVEGPHAKVNTATNDAVCGYPFKVGREYLIYGKRDRHGEFHASLCSGTKLIDDAAGDLAVLGPPRAP